MTLLQEFEQIEEVKKNHQGEFEIQKEKMISSLANISKSIVDSDNINIKFGELISDYLSHSDFKFFGVAESDIETMYVSDKGDSFSFTQNLKKGIVTLDCKNAYENVFVTLKRKRDNVYLSRTTIVDKNNVRITKSEYRKTESGYIETKYSDKNIEDLGIAKLIELNEYNYNKETDDLTKSYSQTGLYNGKVISKSVINRKLEKDEYVIDNGIIHIIRTKDDLIQLRTAVGAAYKKLVNKKLG